MSTRDLLHDAKCPGTGQAKCPEPGLLARRLKTADLLVLIGRCGALAPEQLAALVARCLPSELTADDVLRIDAAVKKLERGGLVAVLRARTTLHVLRAAMRRLYRAAATPPVNPPTFEDRREARRIVAALAAPRRWIEESELHAAAYTGTADRYYVRHKLKSLVRAGLFEVRPLRDPHFVPVVALAPPGRWCATREEARRGYTLSTLSDGPREDELVHHLLLMEAVLRILRKTGGELISLTGDAALRRRTRRGRRTRLGDLLDPVPDAELTTAVDNPNAASLQRHTIEVLVSKYSDRELKAKYRAKWAPNALFVAPTAALCDRVEQLVGRRPDLLDRTPAPTEPAAPPDPLAPPVSKSEPRSVQRQRRYHARSRMGRYDAAIIRQVAGYRVLLVRQIVDHLRTPGQRIARSARYRTVGRLIRRGFLARGQLSGSTGHGILNVVTVTEIGRDLLSPSAAASVARATPGVLASTVLRDHCLQFAEVVLGRFTEGWQFVPRKKIGELFNDEALRRAKPWERRDILWMARAPNIGLPGLHNPTTHEVRLLLSIDHTRRYVRHLAELSKLALYRTLDLELVCTSPALERTARRRIERWADGSKMKVQIHCVPHFTIPRVRGTAK
jgi:hypothetical protein